MKRLGSLDYMRAMGVVLVGLYHGFPATHGLMAPLAGCGWFGVECFFVLSGFLVARGFVQGKVAIGEFYRRRAWRVIPAYLMVLLMGAVIFLLERANAPQFWSEMKEALPHYFTMTQNYSAANPIGNLWSLAAEEHFWMTLPLAVPILLWTRKRLKGWTVLALLLGIAVAIRWGVSMAHPEILHGVTREESAFGRLIYMPTHTHMDGFMVGVWVAVFWDELSAWMGRVQARLAISGGVGLIVLIGTLSWPFRTYAARPMGLMLFGFTALGIGFGAVMCGWMRLDDGSWKAPKVVRWISDRIYSIYLVQGLWMGFCGLGMKYGMRAQMTVFVLFFGLTMVVAIPLYAFIEKPCLEKGRAMEERRKASSGSTKELVLEANP